MANPPSPVSYVLSGDCGATNARLSLWAVKGTDYTAELICAKRYLNEDHQSFIDIVTAFIAENKHNPSAAVFACAGPVQDQTITFSRLSHMGDGWTIDARQLKAELGIAHVQLINDFVAMGYGLLTLKDEECYVLNDVPSIPGGTVATSGAGSGLGQCFLTFDEATKSYTCFPSEGGCTNFCVRTEEEWHLVQHLKAKHNQPNRLDVEQIVSGMGLSDVYDYLAHTYPEQVNHKIHTEWQTAGSLRGGVIGQNASSDLLCGKAMEIVVSAYGAAASDAMLNYLPYGGYYITGGLAPKNLDWFSDKKGDIFLKALFDKDGMSSELMRIPIKIVLAEDCGERGAQYMAVKLLKEAQSTSTHTHVQGSI